MKIKEHTTSREILKALAFIIGILLVIIALMPFINPIQFRYGLANFGFPLWLHFIVFGLFSALVLSVAFHLNKKKL